MDQNFDIQIQDFINAYYYENSISAEEVKKTFGIEDATDEELFAQFTDYEIQMGNDEFEYLVELLIAILYCKSIDDSLQYLEKLELLKEFNDFTMEKTLLNKYLEFENTIFTTIQKKVSLYNDSNLICF